MTVARSTPAARRAAAPPAPPRIAPDAVSASDIRAMMARGELASAREAFDVLVVRHQRRASRIALMYLRDTADADEAVQDAFVRAFTRLDVPRRAPV